MHFSTIAVATFAAVGPLANAHGSGLPQIIGLDVTDVKARNLLRNIGARFATPGHPHGIDLEARDSPPECGEGIGSCPAGKCCSRAKCKMLDVPEDLSC
jgi:hypothetical protein